MRHSHRQDHGQLELNDGVSLGPRGIARALCGTVIAAMVVLGIGAAPALGSIGSVYFDGNGNVGAGEYFFAGAGNPPATADDVGIGEFVMPSITTGGSNTATGGHALFADTSGANNTASGTWALFKNTIGHDNTATGVGALNENKSGSYNVASGNQSLFNNTTGVDNVASGYHALYKNTAGNRNVAISRNALYSNTTGHENVASGIQALYSNTIGDHNIATGNNALFSNTTGRENLASGTGALFANTSGNSNIAVGSGAGGSLTIGSDNIDIANPGVAGESGKIRIGTDAKQNTTYLAAVWGKTAQGPTKAVVVNKNGRLGTAPAPAAPLKSERSAISELRSKLRQQQAENQRQAAAIQRLRKQVRKGG